jgi:hypothetical protein
MHAPGPPSHLQTFDYKQLRLQTGLQEMSSQSENNIQKVMLLPSMPSIDLSVFLFVGSDACSRAAFANRFLAMLLRFSLSSLFFFLRSSLSHTKGSGNVNARKGASLSINEGLMFPKPSSITMKGDLGFLIEPKLCEKQASPMLSSLQQGINVSKLFSVALNGAPHEKRFILHIPNEQEDRSIWVDWCLTSPVPRS